MATQADLAARSRFEFDSLPAIDKQMFRWQQRRFDPQLKENAQKIIDSIFPQPFDIKELEKKYQIYLGYLAGAAQQIGYKELIIAGKSTYEYEFKPSEEKQINMLKKQNLELKARIVKLERKIK
ncbi:hypothetical protein ES707_06716 [subsurface metagenome]